MALADNVIWASLFDGDSTDEVGSVDGVDTNITYSDANGIINNGAGFNGSTSDINFGDNNDASTGAFSIGCWFKSSDTGAFKQIIGKSAATATNSWEIRISSTEKLNVNFREGANVDAITTTTSVTDGNWHSVMATRPASGGTIKLYLDDETPLTTTNNSRDCDNAFDMVVGQTDIGSFPMNGAIDEPTVWNREVSAAEYTEWRNSGVGKQYPFIDPPVAEFSGTPLSGEIPLEVTFTDESTESPDEWLWDFGDETTSTDENPVHEYTEAGEFTVSLTATNAGGSDEEIKIDYVTATEPPAPPEDMTGSRGTSPILTRFPETIGIQPGERHEGIKIGLTPNISHVPNNQKVGLF